MTKADVEILENAWRVAERARAVFGNDRQNAMIVEECSELIKALCKVKRDPCYATERDVEHEAADVLLTVLGMVNQEVFKVLAKKTAALVERVDYALSVKAAFADREEVT